MLDHQTMNSGYHFLVLCHGSERRRMLFEPAREEREDSLELAWQLEEAGSQQGSMEEYLSYVASRLESAGYRPVTA